MVCTAVHTHGGIKLTGDHHTLRKERHLVRCSCTTSSTMMRARRVGLLWGRGTDVPVLPAGETPPKSTSPTPRVFTAGWPACTIAPTRLSAISVDMSKGTAVNVTTTTGAFAAARTALISCCCPAENSNDSASWPSPAVDNSVPTASTTTSAAVACATAAAISVWFGPLLTSAAPGAHVTEVLNAMTSLLSADQDILCELGRHQKTAVS